MNPSVLSAVPSPRQAARPVPSRRPTLEPLEDRLAPASLATPFAAVLGLTAATDSGVSRTDGLTNALTPVLRGAAPGGSTVVVREGVRVVGVTRAAGGSWQLAVPRLAQGPHAFTATAVLGGAAGPKSAAYTVRIDRAVSLMFGLEAGSDTGVRGDGKTARGTVVVAGRTDPAALVTFAGRAVRADAAGRFRIANVALAVGPNALTVGATDRAANRVTKTVTVIRLAPPNVAPVIVTDAVTALSEVPVARDKLVGFEDEFLYRVVGQDAEAGFEAVGYDESAFAAAPGGFGSASEYNASTGTPVGTEWPVNSDILLRKHIDLVAGTTDLVVRVAIDNDVRVFFNGTDVSGGLRMTEDRAEGNIFHFAFPRELLRAGDNVLAVRARDRGGISYVGVEVTADVARGLPGSTPGTELRYVYDVDATDLDGGPLTYSLTEAPAGMTIDAATGVIRWTPAATDAGTSERSYPVTVRVEDGRGGAAEQSFLVVV